MSLDCLIGELSQKNKIKCLPQDPCPVAQNPLQEYLGTLKIQQVEWSIPKGGATMWALGFAQHAVAELLLPRVWHNAPTSAKHLVGISTHQANWGLCCTWSWPWVDVHTQATTIAALQMPQAQPGLLSPATGVPADLSAAATRDGAWL